MDSLISLRERLADYPLAETLIGLCLLALVAVALDWLTRHVLLRVLRRGMMAVGLDATAESLGPIIRRLARIVPAVVVHRGVLMVPHLAPALDTVVRNVAA